MSSPLQQLQQALAECMLADRHRFSRRLEEARRAPQDKQARLLETLVRDLDASRARRAARLASLPRPAYAEDLPVNQKRADIAAAIEKNQVVIICGETGSGKTSQLPKICLELKRGVAGLIGHTQPRRIAARTVATRIAQELKSPLGQAVGFKVRFSDKLSEASHIKLMTDGILLAETQTDRYLNAYDTIIIDEAHERSLNIDFLLGYLKQLLPRRPDLKVIVTSATIDAERFSQYFGGAPVIEVSGRMYPVEVRYKPLGHGMEDEDEQELDMEAAIVDAVDDLQRLGPGDTLVFLPGEREIRDTAERLRKHHRPGAEILPLFARLSAGEQERVFTPSNGRRVVLSTNVAETSLTVPGIRYVIDTGLARLNRYSTRTKVNQLQIEKVSQASANQRAGRCGRVMSGVCVRLYGEDDFAARPRFTDPEILRTSLAGVILRMKALRLPEIEQFPFLEAPTSRAIADGYQQLMELGALDERNNLTAVGRQLARLPIDPKVARMIVAGKRYNCLKEILIIASALSVQDPRERPLERMEAADQRHKAFQDEKSDFLGFIKLWEFFDDALKHKKSNRKLIDQCHEHFLSHVRLREWRDIHGQLTGMAGEMDLRPNDIPASYEDVHKALLSGLIGNVGMKAEEGIYVGARETRFAIHPSSALKKKTPRWILAAELLETTRLYGRCVAEIQPEWVEEVAPHLVRKHYFDPHWERKPAMVSAFERVTLYGLTVTPRRRVHYGPINPREAREIFLRAALVQGDMDTQASYARHNRRLIADIQELEHKARRQDILVDEDKLFAFFDARVPEGIHNGAAFEKWRREAESVNPKMLFMQREDLMRHEGAVTEDLFPSEITIGHQALKLTYRFEPGHVLDGATLTVPLHLLNQLDARRFDWLVPGLLREKVTLLVRSLPATLRRALVPVPEAVTAILGEAGFEQAAREYGDFTAALSGAVKRTRRVDVEPNDWPFDRLPLHLTMNYRVVDDASRELAMGRDLTALKNQLGQAAQLTFAESGPGIEKDNIRGWDFGDLPEEIHFNRGGTKLTGFPALVDEGEHCAIRMFDTRAAAEAAHRKGVIRLLELDLKEQMKQLDRTLSSLTQLYLQLRGLASADDLKDDLLACILDRAFVGEDEPPRKEKDFAQQKQRARTRLPAVQEAALRLFTQVAADTQAVNQALNTAGNKLGRVPHDIRAQLSRLVFKGFLSATPWERLQHLPRYLKGMKLRMDKYPANPERDQRHAPAVAGLWQQYEERLGKHRKHGIHDPILEDFRWQIEELRISLFAQELKTPHPVSIKRLQKLWESVQK